MKYPNFLIQLEAKHVLECELMKIPRSDSVQVVFHQWDFSRTDEEVLTCDLTAHFLNIKYSLLFSAGKRSGRNQNKYSKFKSQQMDDMHGH